MTRAARCFALDHFQRFLQCRRLLAAIELPDPTLDDMQWRAQLVRQRRQEIVFQLVGPFGPLADLTFAFHRPTQVSVELDVAQGEGSGTG